MKNNKFITNIWDGMNICLTIISAITTLLFVVFFVLCFTTPQDSVSYGMITGMCGVFASLWSAFFIALFMRFYEMNKKIQQESKALQILTPNFIEVYTVINNFYPQLKSFATIKDNDMIDYPQDRVYYTDENKGSEHRSFIDFNKEFRNAETKLNSALEKCLNSPMIFQCNESILNLLTKIKLNGLTRNLFEVQAAPDVFNSSNTAYMEIFNNYIEFSDLYNDFTTLINKKTEHKLRILNDSEKDLYVKEINCILSNLPTTLGEIYKGSMRIV